MSTVISAHYRPSGQAYLLNCIDRYGITNFLQLFEKMFVLLRGKIWMTMIPTTWPFNRIKLFNIKRLCRQLAGYLFILFGRSINNKLYADRLRWSLELFESNNYVTRPEQPKTIVDNRIRYWNVFLFITWYNYIWNAD